MTKCSYQKKNRSWKSSSDSSNRLMTLLFSHSLLLIINIKQKGNDIVGVDRYFGVDLLRHHQVHNLLGLSSVMPAS